MGWVFPQGSVGPTHAQSPAKRTPPSRKKSKSLEICESRVSGKGEDLGFAGMSLYFQSFIILPLVFLANALLMWRDWKSKATVLLVGFLPPTLVAVYEFVSLYGQR